MTPGRLAPIALAPIALAMSLLAATAPAAFAQASSDVSASGSEAQSYAVTTEQNDLFSIVEGRIAARRSPTPALRAYAASNAEAHAQSTRMVQAAARASGVATPAPALTPEQRQLVGQLQAASPANFDKVFLEQHRDLNRETLALQRGYAANGGDPNLRRVAGQLASRAAARVAQLEALEP